MNLSMIWIELLVILALIIANGFFSASEIALVAVRRSRIPQLIEAGRRGATTLAALKENPPQFLAAVQIGVTVVGAMASVIAGAATVAFVEPPLHAVAPIWLDPWVGVIALGGTVVVISYVTLVLGELVPKSLALSRPEQLACFAAPVVSAFARLCGPVVRLLTGSTSAVLLLFGRARVADPFVSEDEVKHLVHEGTEAGIFDEAERKLIHSIFEFTDTSVREVMTPRAEMHAVNADVPLAALAKDLIQTGFSRVPVYRGDLDHIAGVVHIKDVFRALEHTPPPALSEVVHPAYFVPDSMQISDLMRELQSRRVHLAIVLNEFGTVVGLVTIEDLLEEIVGEIRDEFDADEELDVQELPDSSLLARGSVPLGDLHDKYGLPVAETTDYRTLAGFVLARLKRLAKGGEAIHHEGYKMTVVALDGRRISKVRIERPGPRVPPAS
ncbi:MAG: HlyC/CorC family transporter [Deltaproteobacteria bacterium]|nr:HlyC/CorC family transporter [Deltaproteobacteria bacterium]